MNPYIYETLDPRNPKDKTKVVIPGERIERWARYDPVHGRYDEPVFCGYQAHFSSRSPFLKTYAGNGKTPKEAIEKLFENVKDKQRLQKMREKLKI